MSNGGRDSDQQPTTIETRIPSRRVGGRYWGPGRFRGALREAVTEGRVKRLRRDQYAPVTRIAEQLAATDDRRRR